MNNKFHFWFVIGLLGFSADLALSQNSQDVDQRSKLVSANWLDRELKSNSNLRLIDLAFRKTNYTTGHIPGAVFADWRKDIIDSENSNLYRLPKKDAMEQLMSRLGVDNDTTIVLTDNMANRASVRMYYSLKYFGHEDVRILNGGTNYWTTSGRKLTTEIPKITATKYKIRSTDDSVFVKMDAVQSAIDGEAQIIDGRPAEQFDGRKPGKVFHTNQPHARLGHVPTAINIPWDENLNEDGTFKTVDELRELYRANGVETDEEIIAYCNEGLHAAMPWFIIRELFGNESAKIYDNSMAEWANRDDTPMNRTESPGSKSDD